MKPRGRWKLWPWTSWRRFQSHIFWVFGFGLKLDELVDDWVQVGSCKVSLRDQLSEARRLFFKLNCLTMFDLFWSCLSQLLFSQLSSSSQRDVWIQVSCFADCMDVGQQHVYFLSLFVLLSLLSPSESFSVLLSPSLSFSSLLSPSQFVPMFSPFNFLT